MADLRRVENPPNPYESREIEWDGEAPQVELEVYEERAKSIVRENDSPDVGFRYSVNPYRGCFHGCVYCYARPGHQYLGMGAGTDFERKIVVKINAAELLDRELARGRTKGHTLAFSGVTDCYQPLEASYRVTRACLEVCAAHGQRVGIVTKGTTIRRDVDLLAQLRAQVFVSIAFSEDELRRGFDPFAPPIDARFDTIRRLADAGVSVGVAVAPIIPGVNDAMIPAILERAHQVGARRSFMTLLRLPAEVRDVFDVSLTRLLPDRARKVKSALSQMRGGKLNDARFGHRMEGSGARWAAIEQLYDAWVRRLGMNDGEDDEPDEPGPPPKGQLSLF